MDDKIKQMIENDIKTNKVMIYMQGTPEMPQCGFSAHAVSIIKGHSVAFGARNVLEDGALRQGVKDFTEWPTIPQIFINGEFVGGADIISEMEQSGELKKMLSQ